MSLVVERQRRVDRTTRAFTSPPHTHTHTHTHTHRGFCPQLQHPALQFCLRAHPSVSARSPGVRLTPSVHLVWAREGRQDRAPLGSPSILHVCGQGVSHSSEGKGEKGSAGKVELL